MGVRGCFWWVAVPRRCFNPCLVKETSRLSKSIYCTTIVAVKESDGIKMVQNVLV